MNRAVKIVLTAAAMLALAGCGKEYGRNDTGIITIEANVEGMTKVSYDADRTAFTAGDRIAVYGWLGNASEVPATRVVDGVVNTLGTDGNWTPERPMLWKPTGGKHYFLGIFPERTVGSFTADAYELDPADYTASDLLIATNLGGMTSQDGMVNLNFTHAMAKLMVNLNFRSQWDATPAVSSVSVFAKTKATVSYLAKSVTATGTESAVELPAAASAPAGHSLSFSSIQVPQDGVRRVVITIDSKKYVYESASDIPLESGRYTTICLNVGRDRVDLGSLAVSDWMAGDNPPEGEAELVEDVLEDLRKYPDLCNVYLSRFDTNHDGILSRKEADAVTVMDVSSQGLDNLLGTWLFPNLTRLDCSSNSFGYLRVHMNPKLEYLDCRNNQILDCIWIAPGQVINEMYLPEPDNPPIDLVVNGQNTYAGEVSKPLSFEATLKSGLTAENLTWVSNLPGFGRVVHQIQGTTDMLRFERAADMGDLESGKLYTMYVETPDGSRSNIARFGVLGKDPLIYFEKPFRDIGVKVDQRLLFSVFFYPGEGESGTPSIKTIGEGCNRSFSSGVKIQEDESIYWDKPGQKKVIVYFEKNGKRTRDTLRVNVNTYIIRFEEHEWGYLPVY